ncbi:MAG: UPF0182 family protein [Abditibacteriota bacterium]|nr:UPF0182 family protein [Abditibacteriota bacterium]
MKILKPLIIVLVILLVCGGSLIGLYTDWLWFRSLEYQSVFTRMLSSKIELGVASGLVFFLIIYANLWIAKKYTPVRDSAFADMPTLGKIGRLLRRATGLFIFVVSIIISVVIGLQATVHWNDFLFFMHPTPFGQTDPVFHRDISFYVFTFPFVKYLYGWLFGSLAFSAILTAVFYYSLSAISFLDGNLEFRPFAKKHLLTLVALGFLFRSYGYIIAMYELLFKSKDSSIFTGASYTAVKVGIPCLWIMLAVCVAACVITFIGRGSRTWKPVLYALGIMVAGNLLFTTLIPNAVQVLFVKPNQLEKEKPYIAYAIKATRDAYALNDIKVREFPAEDVLSAEQVSANQGTIENIRLWDSAQLLESYSQIQTIQQYYSFGDVDVDRYWLKDKNTGKLKYRQVWLSAREMDQSRLPENSRTWVNTRLQYTHGYGYVMSPVNEISREGMPKFFVYDIPPKENIDVPIGNMGIYVGEQTNHEIFVDTKSKEFDYPKGSETVTNHYDGKDGVLIGNWFRRLLFALRFGDINILLNTDINNRSQILFHRNVAQRIETLFPFMVFDSDPYLVTAGGDLFWMLDGFTTSEYYPYSERTKLTEYDTINYVRNSFKIVVNAHSGEVTAYTIDKPVDDPIMRSYRKIYPGVFRDYTEMPEELACHIRYSESVFKIQTDVYKTYHMTDPTIFYNKSDLWDIPNVAEISGNTEGDYKQAPYYTIMKFPESTSEEFILMTTFTRAGRKNMCAWIGAECDGDSYGSILLYNFPKDKNVYGPEQIAAKIKQDDVISPQITLWSQQGSNVNAGNLLVIPVENSVLYVLPLYLESNNTKIPELKRVIVALGDRIIMDESLSGALSKLVGGEIESSGPAPKPAALKPAAVKEDRDSLIKKAAEALSKAKSAQQKGDWAGYGRELQELEAAINALQK